MNINEDFLSKLPARTDESDATIGEVTGNFDGPCRRHGDNFAQILYYGWLAGKTAAEA